MPPDPAVDDRLDAPDTTSRTAAFEGEVVRLREAGCGCFLRYALIDGRVRAVPLNDLVGNTCTVDH